ncbi:DNA polymerase family A-domain-containing protein [Blastocladiella britannica]|nr:DNA polymerase family A-domain-containing protein [Blastocladiella britannica]
MLHRIVTVSRVLRPRALSTAVAAAATSTPSSLRVNPFNIQLLPPALHEQLFPATSSPPTSGSDPAVRIAQRHLSSWELDTSKSTTAPEPGMVLPPLIGNTIDAHFRAIGDAAAEPYLGLVSSWLSRPQSDDPPRPGSWVSTPGWTCYPRDGSAPFAVDAPNDPLLVFDTEVCVKRARYPVMATAMSANAWYGWLSPWLFVDPAAPTTLTADTTTVRGASDLIPLGPDVRVVVGHNVGYDRAGVASEYCMAGTKTRWLDTLSLHVATNGMSSQQRPDFDSVRRINEAVAKKAAAEEQGDIPPPSSRSGAAAWKRKRPPAWMSHTTSNGLAACAEYYLHRTLDKDVRNTFVEAESAAELMDDLDVLMEYCASDVQTTADLFRCVFPQFRTKCPHPVSFAGQLAMGSCFLPVNEDWPQWVAACETRVNEMVDTIDGYLLGLAHSAVLDAYDLSAARTWDGADPLPEFPLSSYLPTTLQLKTSVLREDPWLGQLDWSTKPLKLTKKNEPYKRQVLPNYPKWFRDLWDPTRQNIGVTQRKRVTPLLLRLKWAEHPLVFHPVHKWGYMVAPELQADHVALTPQMPMDHPVKPVVIVDSAGTTDTAPLSETPPAIQFFETWAERGYSFWKLPHKDGDEANAGNPFAKTLAPMFDDGTIRSEHPQARQALELQLMASYWIASAERIRSQFVIWNHGRPPPQPAADVDAGLVAGWPTRGDPRVDFGLTGNTSSTTPPSHYVDRQHWGMILPQMQVMGTITRRAVENTWLTASNAKKKRIGSDIKRLVTAPPGFAIVGADVDAQELWISSVMGDAQLGHHGATALGWMNLQGTKADGTDLHSVTGKILGITRDQAKGFNYARIYGAGVQFAASMLTQHNRHLTHAEAFDRAVALYEKTKGIKQRAKIPSVSPEGRDYWTGGRESYMFNSIEAIAHSDDPRTPALGCQIPNSLMKQHCQSQFMTSRINWVVQSSGVDYLHMLIVAMQHLTDRYNIDARLMITIHDEIRYMVKDEDKYRAAMALQVANAWTRAMFVYKMGMADLPLSVAFFSAVDFDHCLRKEVSDPCITPTNTEGIPPGEALDIYGLLAKGDSASLGESLSTKVPASPKHGSQLVEALPKLPYMNPKLPLSWLLLQSVASFQEYNELRVDHIPAAELALSPGSLFDGDQDKHRRSPPSARKGTRGQSSPFANAHQGSIVAGQCVEL